MENILEKLKYQQNRKSTVKNYHHIWCKFNEFLINLDVRPKTWEDRVCLFGAHLVKKGVQSATLKSYFSAIKHTLKNDNYEWNDNKVCLTALARACRLKNDHVKTRLPIQFGLFELLLFEIERKYADLQPYLEMMYKAMFCLAYYGLLRLGELTQGKHCILAKNVHISRNKDKVMVVLYSSKTHSTESRPQKVKISASESSGSKQNFFCPFRILRRYLAMRGSFNSSTEPFIAFSDGSAVAPQAMRKLLRSLLKSLNLNEKMYDTHSFRIGCATDMLKFNFKIEKIKVLGRWLSNVVYKYLRLCE